MVVGSWCLGQNGFCVRLSRARLGIGPSIGHSQKYTEHSRDASVPGQMGGKPSALTHRPREGSYSWSTSEGRNTRLKFKRNPNLGCGVGSEVYNYCSWLSCTTTCVTWVIYLTFWNLRFFIFKMGIIIVEPLGLLWGLSIIHLST